MTVNFGWESAWGDGIERAVAVFDEVGESGLGLLVRPEVQQALDVLRAIDEGDPDDQYQVQSVTLAAEMTSLAAMSRAANDSPPLEPALIRVFKDLADLVFDGLLRR